MNKNKFSAPSWKNHRFQIFHDTVCQNLFVFFLFYYLWDHEDINFKKKRKVKGAKFLFSELRIVFFKLYLFIYFKTQSEWSCWITCICCCCKACCCCCCKAEESWSLCWGRLCPGLFAAEPSWDNTKKGEGESRQVKEGRWNLSGSGKEDIGIECNRKGRSIELVSESNWKQCRIKYTWYTYSVS